MRYIAVLCGTLLAACATLPPTTDRVATHALADTASTTLGRIASTTAAGHAENAGIHALSVPGDAFAARALLAAAAERSIDAQYYIWHDDQVGNLLWEQLWKAADRGVRVRLLLDDANTSGLDPLIATLDAHPNIEVRLYNPFLHRSSRALDFATDFTRVNRRMHNKCFVVDNQMAVVGGRNIGNEYLGAGNALVFADLDVLATGPVVRDISAEFDLYWNSASAYPASAILVGVTADAAALQAKFDQARADPESALYLEALRDTPLLVSLRAQALVVDWASAQVLRDDPAKTLDTTDRTDVLLLDAMLRTIGPPKRSFDIVSPYFVPGDEGTAALVRLASQGVTVRVLTNSLLSNDVKPVHAGYARRRVDLLRGGVRLFELKPSAASDAQASKALFGRSSSASLHAKTFAIDDARVFVGSFNFDPRSARLNTEMGLVIDSPALARRLSLQFENDIPLVAYEVRLSADGSLQWIERTASGETRLASEPGATAATEAWVRFLGLLSIEWLL